ncbi:MAG: IS91 family transposase [Bacteroidota bacterium]
MKKYEVADVIRQFLPQMSRAQLPLHHLKTLSALKDCRTAALGGHIDECDSCGHLRISYNSCRNRHCPKCQGVNKEMWIVQQEDMLLPVAYFHVVFTMPHELNELCRYQPKLMYDLLFESAWYTLNTFGQNEKWLGAQTAATMVLHTWSQTLMLHPHVHCIVPNGGIAKDGDLFKWQFPKRSNGKKHGNFLFPVAAMKKVYKGYFLRKLKRIIESGLIELPPHFPKGKAYKEWKDTLYSKDWVVYTKKPFSKVENVVNYLARYSHRVAITNYRIQNITEQEVTFQYKDYKDGGKKKTMTLQGTAFLRRFCLHILPSGFRKVRQYGFLSNASKAKKLSQARVALGEKVKTLLTRQQRKAAAKKRLFKTDQQQCPCCKKGQMMPLYSWEGKWKQYRNKSPPVSARGFQQI